MNNTEKISLSFSLTSTDYTIPLGIRVCLDNNVIYENNHLFSEQKIEHSFPDGDADHELTFELFGKKTEHTKINEAGDITTDALLTISDVELDGIDINQILHSLAVYYHDFNGTQAPVESKFYGSLGCNGTVKLRFSTPSYMWLLENM